ncbi:indolepyruvate oxidoreductase subunit beta [Ruminiclostridium cellulolyticum]|uniref:Pyruvate ferredoxin/flavodoxin oxidoreductase n=1 Tax=Ruminiclostridium cellulolyticum (strain ATCC 35319 / DSM 5812 / JCM 6584 / H10) TaxID=394503 RepID=B8I1E6_RUMCH|nr:indolepyruvate oxidoreductase subunit beta [Ruminiclostridium cellulolyticum]ACL75744.1 pyruvate ferredoxin/flavodoxin oxidoreductase [Ruminiclostridium cellulolyticum H10]
MSKQGFDILISGVGGQGTVLASRLIAAAAINQGCFARTAETIGMSQRGGCVVSHVRIDSEKSGSIIPLGGADMIIAFELAEAARSIPRLSRKGCCIVNTQVIKPVSASLGSTNYDIDEINQYIKDNSAEVYFVDGYSLAEKAGNVKAVNVVLLGAATAVSKMPFTKEIMLNTIIENVPQKFRELNQKAFEMGYEAAKQLIKKV